MAKAKATGDSAAADVEGDGSSESDLLEMLHAAAARTSQALSPARAPELESLGAGEPESIGAAAPAGRLQPGRFGDNPPEAIERYLIRQGYPEEQAHALAFGSGDASGRLESFDLTEGPSELPGLERIIGKDMLMQVDYLEAGFLSARAVGRVKIRKGDGGYGTGFLVSPRLLLTNNHVLRTQVMAASSQVEFNYQRNLEGGIGPSVVFDLAPEEFFVTSPVKDLDFALVAVKERDDGVVRLSSLGYHPLTAVSDEILAGSCVTIIQHPKGDPKQIALRENEVLKLPDSGQKFLHYKTGTHPGSSGSPVFNDSWDVVALHHAGKPETDNDGNPVLVDGNPWKSGASVDDIKWVANEGIRVAAIVAYVNEHALTAEQNELFAEALKPRKLYAPKRDVREIKTVATPAEDSKMASQAVSGAEIPDTPVVRERDAETGTPGSTILPMRAASGPSMPSTSRTTSSPDPASAKALVSAVSPTGTVTLTIPLVVSVRLASPTATITGAASPAQAGDESPMLEKIEIERDYSNREGYKADFLGTGALRVPLPRLKPPLTASAAVSSEPPRGGNEYELTYHHFSVVLNRERRLAYFTAVNIDGTQPRGAARETDRWIFDARVEQAWQVGNEFYGRPFDRGHLVRRLDPAWGRTDRIAKQANDDTFHFTNCSPQHAKFNEGKALWAGLEDFLLHKAESDEKRLCVFTGPVFRKSDPIINGVQIPLEFWKVAVALNKAGKLVAAGFLVSQKDLIVAPTLEITVEEVARMFQVRVEKIEALTNLDFGALRKADPVTRAGLLEATGGDEIELDDYEQIVLS
jgi:endonuclease G